MKDKIFRIFSTLALEGFKYFDILSFDMSADSTDANIG
jgi:hypothetical protein